MVSKDITEEEFVAMFPVGTRLSWLDPRIKKWYLGKVVPPDKGYKKYPQHEPRVWFLLDIDEDEESRFVFYEYRNHIELVT